jgi:hypothetical protein
MLMHRKLLRGCKSSARRGISNPQVHISYKSDFVCKSLAAGGTVLSTFNTLMCCHANIWCHNVMPEALCKTWREWGSDVMDLWQPFFIFGSQGSNTISFTGVHHVAVICKNLEKSMDFYLRVLGKPTVVSCDHEDSAEALPYCYLNCQHSMGRRHPFVFSGLSVNPDRPHDKLPYRGAWLMVGPEMVHLMELPNPDPMEGRPEVTALSVWYKSMHQEDDPHLRATHLPSLCTCSMEEGIATSVLALMF